MNKTFTVGLNRFADMTPEEFNAYNRFRMPDDRDHNNETRTRSFDVDKRSTLPSYVDWRTQGAVSSIKDQGSCGCCYSFSVAGSIEGAWAISKGNLLSLSRQQLVDCSTSYGNSGCNGGYFSNSFKYVTDKGIQSDSSYPFTSGTSGTAGSYCLYNSNSVVAKIKSYVNVASNELALTTAIANIGPISVAIDASQNSFQLYTSGVYYEPACSSTTLNHAVLAVGYGTDGSGNDYYIVKNSWGTTWGMSGYILMARNQNNNCGIAATPAYPVV